MNVNNSIGRQTFFNYSYNVENNKARPSQGEFKDVFSKKIEEEIADRFNNYSKGISTPSVLLNKPIDTSEPIFEDVTFSKEFESMQESGPYKLYRTFLDNGEGNGGKAEYILRLRVSSKDVKIDNDKLQDIFHNAITIVKAMMPIYAKMNGTAIEAGVDYQLPFDESTGTVDFEDFIKQLIEGTSGLVTVAPVDDDTKAELQRMLKECEDFLLKSIKKKDPEKDTSLDSERKNVLTQKQVIDAEGQYITSFIDDCLNN